MRQTARRDHAKLIVGLMIAGAAILSSSACARKQIVRIEEVQRPKPRIESVEHDQPEGARQGSTVTVTLKGDANLKATASLPGIADEILLTEESPGVYKGYPRLSRGLAPEGQVREFPLQGRLEAAADNFATHSGQALKVIGDPKPVVVEEEEITAARLNQEHPLGAVYFDFSRFDLRPEGVETMRDSLDLIRKYPKFSVLIEGHCDERGTNEYNMALGDQRAIATKMWLINQGVTPDRLRHTSYGEERPAEAGHDEAAWAKNRRAVLLWEE